MDESLLRKILEELDELRREVSNIKEKVNDNSMAIDHIDKKVSIYNNELMSALVNNIKKTNEMPKTDELEFKK